jgi:hypothetical protein
MYLLMVILCKGLCMAEFFRSELSDIEYARFKDARLMLKNFLAAWGTLGVEIEDYFKGWSDVVAECLDNKVLFVGERSKVYFDGRTAAMKYFAGKLR